VLKWIQDEYGVTAEEARKMVSDSKISAEEFSALIEKNIGGAALSSAKSFSGGLRNVRSALSRFGAQLGSPVFEGFKKLWPPIIGLIDRFTAAIKPATDALGKKLAPAFDRIAEWLDKIDFENMTDGLSDLKSLVGPLLPVIGGLAGAFGGLASKLPLIGGLFAGLSGPIGIAAGALAALFLIKPEDLKKGFDTLKEKLPGWIDEFIAKAKENMAVLVPALVEAITTNGPILLRGMRDLLKVIGEAILEAVTGAEVDSDKIPQAIGKALAAGAKWVFDGAVKLFGEIGKALLDAIEKLPEKLNEIMPTILGWFDKKGSDLNKKAGEFFGKIVDALPTILPDLSKAITDLAFTIGTWLLASGDVLAQKSSEFWQVILDTLSEKSDEIATAVGDAIQAAITSFNANKDAFFGKVNEFWDSIIEGLNNTVDNLDEAIYDLAEAAGRYLAENGWQVATGAAAMFATVQWELTKLKFKVLFDLGALLVNIIGLAPQWKLAGLVLSTTFGDGIKEKIQLFFDELPGKLLAGITGIIPGGSQLFQMVGSLFGGVFSGNITSKVSAFFAALPGQLARGISNVIPGGRLLFEAMGFLFGGRFADMVKQKVSSFFSELPGKLRNGVEQVKFAAQVFFSLAGSFLGEKFKSGILGPLARLAEEMYRKVKDAVDRVKRFLEGVRLPALTIPPIRLPALPKLPWPFNWGKQSLEPGAGGGPAADAGEALGRAASAGSGLFSSAGGGGLRGLQNAITLAAPKVQAAPRPIKVSADMPKNVPAATVNETFNVTINASARTLKELKDIEDFIGMVKDARLNSRRVLRSGSVAA
jgi:hypothetical protein